MASETLYLTLFMVAAKNAKNMKRPSLEPEGGLSILGYY